jgi:hypothetical protein
MMVNRFTLSKSFDTAMVFPPAAFFSCGLGYCYAIELDCWVTGPNIDELNCMRQPQSVGTMSIKMHFR